jgi:hypothetical protein
MPLNLLELVPGNKPAKSESTLIKAVGPTQILVPSAHSNVLSSLIT